jgi:glycosyltransferase involved in cell wall biosynthesis
VLSRRRLGAAARAAVSRRYTTEVQVEQLRELLMATAPPPAGMTERRLVILGQGWFPDDAGGLNRYVRDLFEAHRDVAWSCRCVVVGPAGDAPGEVRVVSRGEAPLPARILAYLRAAVRAGRGLVTYDAHFALYAAAPMLLMRGRRRFVCHFHGPWAQESASGGDGGLRVGAKRRLEGAVYRRADRVVVLSRAFGSLLSQEYGVDEDRIAVIPPGVDLQRFSPGSRQHARRQLGIPGGAWVAASVRRLVPRTGVDVLLAAWATVVAQADGAAVLLIAGTGSEQEALRQRAHELQLGDSVRFLGRVEDAELPALYRAADLCVVPTVALEGFGLVVLESLACGTPVVAADVGGLREALGPLSPGLLVPPGDPQALADRLAAVRAGHAPMPDAVRCRAWAEEHSWRACLGRHEDVYFPGASALEDHRPAPVHCRSLVGGQRRTL